MFFEVIAAIVGYCLSSLGIIYFNKWVFSVALPYPIFITWVQQVGGVALYYVLALISDRTGGAALSEFEMIKPDIYILRRCFWQIFTFAAMVATANYCLQVVQISTYQVARSMTLIFGIIFSKIMINKVPTPIALVGCMLLVTGMVIGSLDPDTLTLSGLIMGGLSSLFQALNQVLVAQNMDYFEGRKGRLLYYNMLGSSFMMIPLIFLFREEEAFSMISFNPTAPNFGTTWMCMIGSAVFCILINLTTFLCISLTSPVTMSVIGFSKSVIQALGSIIFLGDIVTLLSFVSLMISFCGSGLYSAAQIAEMRRNQATKDVDELELLEDGASPQEIAK